MSQRTRLIVLVIALICAVTIVSGGEPAVGTASPTASIQASAIPVGFIANTGMQDPSVLYFARPAGSVIFCTRDEVVIVKQPLSDSGEAGTGGAIIHLSVEGADPQSVDAVDPLPGTVNMILGSDPSKWQSNLPVYGAVRYTNILPGIDHLYRANGAVLKREFLISPDTDPSSLILHYGGVTGIQIDSDGALLLSTTSGVLREAPPVCYQDSPSGRVLVECRYVILGEDSVGFALGQYNPALSIVIDPQLEYSTFLGGSSDECGYAIAIDADGYAYITGSTVSTDFPVRSAYSWTKKGWTDIFVTKFDFTTSKLVYSTYIGGRLDEVAYAITLNDGLAGTRAYITGYTGSDDYPTLNPIDPTWVVYNPDIIVTALEADGTALYFSTVYGGSMSDYGRGIKIDPLDATRVWVTGYTFSCDFVPDISTITYVPFQDHVNLKEICPDASWCCVMGADAFLAEFMYDETVPATTLEYSTYISGYDDDRGYALFFDNFGDPIVVGTTSSPNFPLSHPFQGNLQGYSDAFVTMLDVSATNPYSEAMFSTYFGGSGDEVAQGVTLVDGLIAIAGTTDSPDLPLQSPWQNTLAGEKDAFLTIFNAANTDLEYSTYYGGSYTEHVSTMVATDTLDKVYIAGYTRSHDFPLNGSIKKEMLGFQDAFITGFTFDPASTFYIPVADFSTYLGGDLGDDEVTGIALDADGNFYATGYTGAKDFPLVSGSSTYQGRLKGFQDAFLVKFNLTNPPVPPVPPVLIADFTASPLTGQVPLSVQFTDASVGSPILWSWTFGDGGTGSGSTPLHTYQYPGNYTVNLTVTDAYGSNFTSKVEYINPYDDRTPNILLFFVPSNLTVPIGMNRKVAMYLNRTPTGIDGYNFTLSFGNLYVALFSSAQRPPWSMGPAYTGTLPASSISLIGIDYNSAVAIGQENVPLGNITLTGSTTGVTNITLSAVGRFEDRFGNPVNLTIREANVTAGMLLPLPGYSKTPKDLNGDWLFEDVNGDNKFSFADLIAFFENLEWMADNEPYDLFDFDGNHKANFGDIIVLFHLL